MATNNPLRDQLLQQAQLNGAGGPADAGQTIQTILARDEARVRRMKKLTLLAWIAFPVSFIVVAVLEWLLDSDLVVPVGIMVVQMILLIAVSFTISLYVRSRTLTMHQIQSGLSNIEALLRQLTQEKH